MISFFIRVLGLTVMLFIAVLFVIGLGSSFFGICYLAKTYNPFWSLLVFPWVAFLFILFESKNF